MISKKILSAIIFSLMALMPAQAQSFMEHRQALEQLDALFVAPENQDITTLKNNPKLQELMNIITDDRKYLEGMPMGLQTQSLMCLGTHNITKKFMFLGMTNGEQLIKNPRSLDAASRELLGKNMAQFQTELERLEIFQIKCTANIIKEMIAFYNPNTATEELKKSIQDPKFATFQALFNTIVRFHMVNVPLNHRINLSKALADAAPIFVSIFGKQHRTMIVEGVKRLTKDPLEEPTIIANMSIILQALDQTSCTPLCEVD